MQFYHKRLYKQVTTPDDTQPIAKGGTTYVVDSLSIHGFKDLMEGRIERVALDMGVAKCNPKENYNKKLGRIVATGRKKQHTFKIHGKSIGLKTLTILLKCEETGLVVRFDNKHDSSRVHMTKVLS